MGGKNKPNRTKDNTRPSSSARSAQLLANQPTTFFAFGINVDKNATSVGFTAKDVDSSAGPFEIVLKKMTKKDAITKLKALQEFTELCLDSDVDAVKATLPYWSRIFCQLCGDPDHRIREATLLSHKVVISKVKKYLAPYLKEIIGPWFTSQFDTYAPCASAAVAAFQEAFSAQKYAEAIAFCQDEILEYYYENLTVHTPQTLSNVKVCTAEEVEEKYRRVVTSSLLGYASYLQSLTKGQIMGSEEANKKLVSSAKFWKKGQNKDPLIRCGFFNVLASLCKHATWLIQPEAARLSGMLFNNLTENDPIVLPVFFDAVVNVVYAVPECWKHGNVVKQLFTILKSGGKGHATSIFPKIVPLLSSLPEEKMGDKWTFFNEFFTNMRIGMSDPAVGRSRSESLAVAKAYVDAFQHFVLLNCKNEALIKQLIDDHLLATLQSQFLAPPPVHGTTEPFLCYVAQLLQMWNKGVQNYDLVVKQFWNGIEEILLACLDSEVFPENAKLILKFLEYLKNPEKFITRFGRERVKFTDDDHRDDIVEIVAVRVSYITDSQRLSEILTNSFAEKFKLNEDVRILDTLIEMKKLYPSFVNFGPDTMCACFATLVEKQYPAEILTELCMIMLPNVSEDIGLGMLGTVSQLKDLDCLQFCRLLPCDQQQYILDWIQSENFDNIYFNLLDMYLLEERVGMEAAAILCKFINPKMLLDQEMTVAFFKKLAWAVSSRNILHDRITVLVQALNRDICLNEAFKFFAVELFAALCADDDVSLSLFRSTLKKIMYSWTGHDIIWHNLIRIMKQRMFYKNWNVDNLISAIDAIIDVVYDEDLEEICEATSIHTMNSLVKTILEYPPQFIACGEKLKNYVLDSCELLGMCSIKYFHLKKTNKIDNESKKIDNESKKNKKKSKNDIELTTNLVQDFIKWLQFSSLLINKIILAYPVTHKAIDLFQQNKLEKGEFNLDAITNMSLEDDEYPDEELLTLIINEVLDVMEHVRVLELILVSGVELEFYGIILNQCQSLKNQVLSFLSSVTPSDFKLIYSVCENRTQKSAYWHLLNLLSYFPKWSICEKKSDEVPLPQIQELLGSSEITEDPQWLMELASIVKLHSQTFSLDVWDKLFIELHSLLKRTDAREDSILLLGAISSLFLTMKNRFKEYEEANKETELVLVWNNVAEKELWLLLYYKWRQFTEHWKPCHDDTGHRERTFGSCPLRLFCEAVCVALEFIPKEDEESLTEECVPLLLSTQISLQTTAFNILSRLNAGWVESDADLFRSNVSEPSDSDDKWLMNQEEMDCEWSLPLLGHVLYTSQTVVEALLSDFNPGDTCTVQPFTDAFTYTHGYLLIWSIIYEMCEKAHFALRYQYAAWLRKNGHLWILLESVLKLLPANVVHGEANKEILPLFKNQPRFVLNEAPCSSWIEHGACNVFRMSLQWVASAVREWWSELEHPVSNLVSKIASDHVSPLLISAELKAVQNYSDSIMSISVFHKTREIIANYTIDDALVQLALNVPPNYPLGTIKAESKTQNLAHRAKWVALFLAKRNCSLCDALLLWKSELDKRFEGVDPCHICFSLFYGSGCELPKPCCSTCHKKFHSACLYKWFDTSNKSTCPYCRNKF